MHRYLYSVQRSLEPLEKIMNSRMWNEAHVWLNKDYFHFDVERKHIIYLHKSNFWVWLVGWQCHFSSWKRHRRHRQWITLQWPELRRHVTLIKWWLQQDCRTFIHPIYWQKNSMIVQSPVKCLRELATKIVQSKKLFDFFTLRLSRIRAFAYSNKPRPLNNFTH